MFFRPNHNLMETFSMRQNMVEEGMPERDSSSRSVFMVVAIMLVVTVPMFITHHSISQISAPAAQAAAQ